MLIVNYKDFVKMPAGTVYATYSPCILGELHIKTDEGHARADGWYFNGAMPLLPYVEAFQTGEPHENNIAIYDTDSTDYDETDFFAIFQPRDIERMIAQLRWALDDCRDLDIINDYF